MTFVLEDQPKRSSTICSAIEDADVFETPFVASDSKIVEKAFLRFFRFDVVIAQMLDIPILLVFIIPFEGVPVRCHSDPVKLPTDALSITALNRVSRELAE